MTIEKVGAWKTLDGKLHETAAAAEQWQLTGPLEGLRGETLGSYAAFNGQVKLLFIDADNGKGRTVMFSAFLDSGRAALRVDKVRS